MRLHFVTGATGFVGHHLVSALLARGEAVAVLIRRNGSSARERAAAQFPDGMDQVCERFFVLEGDVTQPGLGLGVDDLDLVRRHVVTVWHLAANLSLDPRQRHAVLATNVLGTRNVVAFANEVAERLYHMSTAFVAGDYRTTFAEDALEQGQSLRNMYERSKYAAEALVRRDSRIPYVILRPSIIIGRAAGGKAEGCTFGYFRIAYLFYRLKLWLARSRRWSWPLGAEMSPGRAGGAEGGELAVPWLVLPYPAGCTVDVVHVDDVIRMMLEADAADGVLGHTLHLTQPSPPAFRFLFRSGLHDLGFRQVKLLPVPPRLFERLFLLMSVLFPALHPALRTVRWYLPYFSRPNRFSRRNGARFLATEAGPITRALLRDINSYAQQVVFSRLHGETDPDVDVPLAYGGTMPRPS